MTSSSIRPATPCGRLAPSPTGLLHLGNAWAFLIAWLSARMEGGRLILRMEDIDPARSRREWADGILEDLRWLGLDWDEGPDIGGPCGPYEQSARFGLYENALERLIAAGHAYPCFCTRKELRTLAGAPQGAEPGALGDMGAPYPGTCRVLSEEARAAKMAEGRSFSWRLACPEGGIAFEDDVLGLVSHSFADCGGDFALRRSDGVWAYQLAVSVDDAMMGVTHVVRGEDIAWSTPRQLLLLKLFGAAAPRYAHVPLLHDSQGERLAKRHAALSLRALREAGARPERVVGLLAEFAGFGGNARSAAALLARLKTEHAVFPWALLRRDTPLCLQEDDVLIPGLCRA